MKRLLLFIFICAPQITFACSCLPFFFCNALHSNAPLVAFKGVVIDTVTYNETNQVVVIKVLKRYRDDFGLTDTLRLFGQHNTAGCAVDVLDAFHLGDTIRVLTKQNYQPADIPGVPQGHYYQNYLVSCATKVIYNRGSLVNGYLYESDQGKKYYEYPADLIETALDNCSFGNETLTQTPFDSNQFDLLPNPVSGNFFYIKPRHSSIYKLDKVRLIAVNGRLVREYPATEFNIMQEFDLSGLPRGVYIVEVVYQGQSAFKRLVAP